MRLAKIPSGKALSAVRNLGVGVAETRVDGQWAQRSYYMSEHREMSQSVLISQFNPSFQIANTMSEGSGVRILDHRLKL